MGKAADLANVVREFVVLNPRNPRDQARAYLLRERQRELMAPHTRCVLDDRERNGIRLVTVVYGVDGAALC
ncbi:hypothetical protein [Saccharothrix lopnurensis]|uniref:Uncharacterized protein n=1 Tax=Saccharothrix lopnurensis TaxID=1670621 RepID=A0ABW1P605_9PSEU